MTMQILWLAFLLLLGACSAEPTTKKNVTFKNKKLPPRLTDEHKKQGETIQKTLAPLHKEMEKPQAGDWLDMHKEEGQNFLAYMQERQLFPELSKKWIVILPIGDFSPKQKIIFQKAIQYLGAFYQLRTHILPAMPVAKIPKKAIRKQTLDFQIHTSYVLDELLLPKVSDTIACLLAFTAIDLYPYPSWNFVFGQASLTNRMGVWSMNRFGNPEQDDYNYRACLMHTIKTAIHEAGHIFNIRHCAAYMCCMAGSNSLTESARHPVMFCPVCTAKVGAQFEMDLVKQHEALARFWKENDFPEEQAYFEKAGKALKTALAP